MPPTTQHLIPELTVLAPSLIIFDKDGTLIDFHAMWAGWVTELARRLETTTGLTIANQLFKAMDFDPDTGRITPTGRLAVSPMADLRSLTSDVLRESGLSAGRLEAAMTTAWHTPDPVALVHPLADLPTLFRALRLNGLSIAVVTSDDHAPTEATLTALGVAAQVDAIVGADDGHPVKPAPDMLLAVCHTLNIPPARTVVVGDNVPELQMGQAAGAGLTVGVLSGVSSAEILAPYADILLPSIGGLIQ
jgi:phosphoglycolate phosphatase-like HAD superfamily hydrolase